MKLHLIAGALCLIAGSTFAQSKTLRTAEPAPQQQKVSNIADLKVDKAVVAPQQVLPSQTSRALSGGVASVTKPLTNDPFNVRTYTLSNGLTVFISPNKEVPRVQTLIAVRAGSKFDPAETTGLAHYLEHMVFKGTNQLGTKDWAKEKVLLDSVSANFEYHKNEKDPAKKKKLYAKIDSFSYEASKYAIPNEYDKMTTSLGAQGTNAFTSTDMTVYVNDIPSNALDKFLKLESDRFQNLVLRLFHTELETVYEEFNRNQDNDRRWSDHNIDNALLPNHPYGTQTTIGEGEHLKNPSMVNIHNYFSSYYRPNNVAIILAGDVDPDKTVALIEKYFGGWKANAVPQFIKKPAPELATPAVREYVGPQPEHVYVGYLFNGANTKDALMARLIDMILANGEAGLIDLDLVQQQKILQGYSFIDDNTDYVFHKLYGEPKQGQSLDEVKNLLLGEIEKVKKGEFGDWVLPAIIQNLRLQRMQAVEKNDSRAYAIMSAYVHDIPWNQWVNELDEMEKITKSDIVAFANKYYRNNYAVSYKRQGDAKVHKVEKPEITAVVMNKDEESLYKQNWDKMDQPSIQPKFIDFDKDIAHLKIDGKVEFDYIQNKVNKLFSVNYIFDMGTDNVRNLGLAISYLEYLGTNKYSAEQLKQEFYKLGVSFKVTPGRDRVIVSLSGLESNFEKGLQLFEHILANVKPDKEVYEAMVMDILQSRANAKKNKGTILYSGLLNYGKYGKVNPFNNVMSEDELKKQDINQLVDLIKSLGSYKHKIFYYGQLPAAEVMELLQKEHPIKTALKNYPEAKKYPELALDANKVYVAYYPMKQAEIILLAKDVKFDKTLYPAVYLYNDYYGSGLSSIMFQEIREKMALAYSVYSSFGVPQYATESHYITSYVGTQSDKLRTALAEMDKLLNNMPEVPQQYDGARASVIKTLESDWITGVDMYWAYDRAQKRGLNYDVRKDIYEKAKTMTLADVHTFFNQHVKGKKYTYLVIGKKEDLNMDALKELGPVEEVDLKTLYGY